MSRIRAYFDGCCEPVNPGGAMGVGAIIYLDGTAIHEYSYMYSASKSNSNNVAEYLAFTEIVDHLLNLLTEDGSHRILKDLRIDIRGDNKMVVEQMNERWRIKKGYYAEFAHEAKKGWEGLRLLCKDQEVPLTLDWVPRELNDKADGLSKKELIAKGIEFRIQPLKENIVQYETKEDET